MSSSSFIPFPLRYWRECVDFFSNFDNLNPHLVFVLLKDQFNSFFYVFYTMSM